MKHKLIFSLVFLFIIFSSSRLYSQTIPNDSLYLGQSPPGNTQKIFPLSVSPGYSAVERIAFSSDGKEIYYSELSVDYSYNFNSARIKHYSYYDNKWNGPTILFNGFYSPALSVDGNTMFFQKVTPREVWYSEKTDTGWGAPAKFSNKLALERNLHQVNSGNYYCITNNNSGGRFFSKLIITSTDTTIQNFGFDASSYSYSSSYLDVAKDESYVIIYTLAGGNPIEGRALISYPNHIGSWTTPKSMSFGGWATTISLDKKYMFYSSIVGLNYAIYWIRVDNIIDSLKYTNFAPQVKSPIPVQTGVIGTLFNYTIPDSTFYDEDNDSLTYSATKSSGSPLPSWLLFDPATRTFSGTPITATVKVPLSIKVIATDPSHASSSCVFNLTITNSSGTEEKLNRLPEISTLGQNYPNPFNPTTEIQFALRKRGNYSLKVFNMLGQVVATIIDGELSAGIHQLIFDGSKLSSGMYTYKLTGNNVNLTKKMLLIK